VDWNNDGNDIIFNDDIINKFFAGNQDNIIWGFTGATGGATGTNKVCNILLDFEECPPSYSIANNNKLTGLQTSHTDFETNSIIQSDETINDNTTVFYDSATLIEMLNGFEVKIGAFFNAFIDGCGNILKDEKEKNRSGGL